MPIFEGEDPMGWLTKIERYFRLQVEEIVQEFIGQFEKHVGMVKGLEEPFLVEVFLKGLKEEISTEGWFDLASARHSMGASRINSSLLDLKFHSAATTLKITNYDGTQPCFMLRKWVSSEHESSQLEDENVQSQDGSSVKSSGMVFLSLCISIIQFFFIRC
ncbi:hypothetical protein HKD37_19G054222 [Glycine soja]